MASGLDRKGLTFPGQLRLRRKAQFETVYSGGRRFGDGFFSVTVRSNETGLPRLGLTVSTKIAGNSVERNRIRRVIRESFRLHQLEFTAVDIVVGARARAKGTPNALLRTSLAALWDKVRKTCASPPKP